MSEESNIVQKHGLRVGQVWVVSLGVNLQKVIISRIGEKTIDLGDIKADVRFLGEFSDPTHLLKDVTFIEKLRD